LKKISYFGWSFATLPHPAFGHLLLKEKGNGNFITLERRGDNLKD
jgi:hypothetical protein